MAGPPSRLRVPGAAASPTSPVIVLGVGNGGVKELQRELDESSVAWALLPFKVGSGAFARTKLVAVHFNSDRVPTVKRGRLNARTAEALSQFGDVHATIEVKSKEELTLDHLCSRLEPLLISDSFGDGSSSSKGLKEQYENLIVEQSKQAAGKRRSRLRSGRTARESSGETATRALEAVGSATGRYNWVLLEPTKLDLENAGCGGMVEMQEWLSPEKVLFGVVRFTFAQGAPAGGEASAASIMKHLFLHWVGPKVSIVKRGQWNSKNGAAEAKVRQVCNVSVRREAHCSEDLDLKDLIREFRRLAVVDGGAGAENKASQISVEEYMASLKMEVDAQLGDEDVGEDPLPELAEAVRSVRAGAEDSWNWVLVGIGQGGLVSPAGSAPASPRAVSPSTPTSPSASPQRGPPSRAASKPPSAPTPPLAANANSGTAQPPQDVSTRPENTSQTPAVATAGSEPAPTTQVPTEANIEEPAPIPAAAAAAAEAAEMQVPTLQLPKTSAPDPEPPQEAPSATREVQGKVDVNTAALPTALVAEQRGAAAASEQTLMPSCGLASASSQVQEEPGRASPPQAVSDLVHTVAEAGTVPTATTPASNEPVVAASTSGTPPLSDSSSAIAAATLPPAAAAAQFPAASESMLQAVSEDSAKETPAQPSAQRSSVPSKTPNGPESGPSELLILEQPQAPMDVQSLPAMAAVSSAVKSGEAKVTGGRLSTSESAVTLPSVDAPAPSLEGAAVGETSMIEVSAAAARPAAAPSVPLAASMAMPMEPPAVALAPAIEPVPAAAPGSAEPAPAAEPAAAPAAALGAASGAALAAPGAAPGAPPAGPTAAPMAVPMAAPVAAPAAEPAADLERATPPSTAPGVVEPAALPAAEPAADLERATPPATAPGVVEPAALPGAEPAAEPVAKPATELAAARAAELAAVPAAVPAAASTVKPAPEPAPEPVAVLAEAPVEPAAAAVAMEAAAAMAMGAAPASAPPTASPTSASTPTATEAAAEAPAVDMLPTDAMRSPRGQDAKLGGTNEIQATTPSSTAFPSEISNGRAKSLAQISTCLAEDETACACLEALAAACAETFGAPAPVSREPRAAPASGLLARLVEMEAECARLEALARQCAEVATA